MPIKKNGDAVCRLPYTLAYYFLSAHTRALYKAKGYSEDWIEKRMRGIAIREELTGE